MAILIWFWLGKEKLFIANELAVIINAIVIKLMINVNIVRYGFIFISVADLEFNALSIIELWTMPISLMFLCVIRYFRRGSTKKKVEIKMAPRAGLEPATNRLTVYCSTN